MLARAERLASGAELLRPIFQAALVRHAPEDILLFRVFLALVRSALKFAGRAEVHYGDQEVYDNLGAQALTIVSLEAPSGSRMESRFLLMGPSPRPKRSRNRRFPRRPTVKPRGEYQATFCWSFQYRPKALTASFLLHHLR